MKTVVNFEALHSLPRLQNKWPADSFNAPSPQRLALDIMRNKGNVMAHTSDLLIDTEAQGAIQQFAKDNGWQYRTYDQSLLQYRPPAVKQLRWRPVWMGGAAVTPWQAATQVVRGQLGSLDFALFSTVCLVTTSNNQSAKNSAQYDRRGVLKIRLPKTFPHLVLDSNKNDKRGLSTIDEYFEQDQRILLEGDFNKYFDFYAPKGIQANSLTVLAPNFMDKLAKAATRFDVEFFGNEVVIATRNPLFSQELLQELFAVADELVPYLERLLRSWSYVPTAQPFDMLKRPLVAAPALKIGSHRINTGWIAVILLAIMIASWVLYALMIYLK